MRRALKILADREVSPQTGLLKSTLLQLDSTFSERNYGASSFLDFTEKLAQAGLVQLKHAGRSVMVELNPSFDETAPETVDRPIAAAAAPLPMPQRQDNGHGRPDGPAEPLPPIGDNAEGVRTAGELLRAATNARWPMYLRNAKQILRAGSFDERRYGFGGLIDLFRACSREGLVRMERDRRGGLRLFQGPALTHGVAARPKPWKRPNRWRSSNSPAWIRCRSTKNRTRKSSNSNRRRSWTRRRNCSAARSRENPARVPQRALQRQGPRAAANRKRLERENRRGDRGRRRNPRPTKQSADDLRLARFAPALQELYPLLDESGLRSFGLRVGIGPLLRELQILFGTSSRCPCVPQVIEPFDAERLGFVVVRM